MNGKKNNSKLYEVIIIGGGAAGLAAGCRLAENNINTLIIEKGKRIGRKILASGGGKCNFSNKNKKIEFYHGSCINLAKICENYNIPNEFESHLGLLSFFDDCGRYYPFGENSSCVLDALRLKIENEKSISVLTEDECIKISHQKNLFEIHLQSGMILNSKYLIYSTGSKASPKNGGCDSFNILKNMGIKINPLSPALCPLKCSENISEIKGIRFHAEISLYNDEKLLYSENGEVQINSEGFSGICIMNASCFAKSGKDYRLKINFIPKIHTDKIEQILSEIYKSRSNFKIEDSLSGILNKRLAMHLIKRNTDFKTDAKLKSISEKVFIEKTKKFLSESIYYVKKSSDFSMAQVSAGGIDINEIKPNLESCKYDGMYFCGECIDINAICGGYNLMWAFSSALYASDDIINREKAND